MRFLLDEQLSRKLVGWFEEKGHQAEHVEDMLGRAASDRDIAAHGAVVVSKDADFLELLKDPGIPALVLISTGNMRTRDLIAVLESSWADTEAALQSGKKFVELR